MNKSFSALMDSLTIEQLTLDQLERLPFPFHNKDIFDKPEPFLFTVNSKDQNEKMRKNLLTTNLPFNLIVPIFEVYEDGLNRYILTTDFMVNFKNIIYLEKWLMEQIIESILIDQKFISDEDLFPFFQRQQKLINGLISNFNKYDLENDRLIEYWINDIYKKLIEFRIKHTIQFAGLASLLIELEQKIEEFLTFHVKKKLRSSSHITLRVSLAGSQNLIKIHSNSKQFHPKQSISRNSAKGDIQDLYFLDHISIQKINGMQLYKSQEWENFHEVKQNALLSSEIKNDSDDESDKLVSILQNRRRLYLVDFEFRKLSQVKTYDKKDRKEFLLKLYGLNTHYESILQKTMICERYSSRISKSDSIPRESVILFKNLKIGRQAQSNIFHKENLRKPGKWQTIRELYVLSQFLRKYSKHSINFAKWLIQDTFITKMEIFEEFSFNQSLNGQIIINFKKDRSIHKFQ